MAKVKYTFNPTKKELQGRVMFLEKMIRRYYMANYQAKKLVGENLGRCFVSVLEDPGEECLIFNGAEDLREIIVDLPLWDCGC